MIDPQHAATGGGPIWQFHRRFERLFERFRAAYEGLLGWALDHRFATVASLLAFALGSLLLAVALPVRAEERKIDSSLMAVSRPERVRCRPGISSTEARSRQRGPDPGLRGSSWGSS